MKKLSILFTLKSEVMKYIETWPSCQQLRLIFFPDFKPFCKSE